MKMIIISILNEKGGAGKTTVSTNLACALMSKGYDVLLVDSDKQGSARDWSASAGDESSIPPIIGLDRPGLFKDLRQIGKSYDYVIVDGAPNLRELSVSAIKTSDHIIIPIQPSPYDIWAAESFVELIKTRQEITDGKPTASFLISRQIVGTKLSQDVRQAIVDYELPVMASFTSQRVIYPERATVGQSVIGSGDKEAEREIKALAEEVISWG